LQDFTAPRTNSEITDRAWPEQFRDLQPVLDALTNQLRGINLQGAPPEVAERVTTSVELVGWLVEMLRGLVGRPTPDAELAAPYGGVLRVRAHQVEQRDRLIADLRMGHEWPDRPEVAAVERGGIRGGLVVLTFAGDGAGEHALGALDPVLVDRPAPVPPATPEAIATMAAALSLSDDEVPESARGTGELVDQVDDAGAPSTQDTPPAFSKEGEPYRLPGGPVRDPQRGELWLPSSPRGWAGSFVRREVAR
jgi:hypothetical protein